MTMRNDKRLRQALRDALDILNSSCNAIFDPDDCVWVGYRAGVEVCRSHTSENCRDLVIASVVQAAKDVIEEALKE